jgi:phosphoenolpyruvate carboxylase
MRRELEEAFEQIRKDLDLVMGCFREVLWDLGEDALADHLPWSEGGEFEFEEGELPDRAAQVMAIAFQLLNMVEENRANQAMRKRESDHGAFYEQGLWGYHLKQLDEAGYGEEEILEAINTAVIEPVLTAHPTEAKRWSVLQQHREIYLLLVSLENSMYTPFERERLRRDIKVALERLWRTGEILLAKPDLATERKNVLYYLSEVFPVLLRDTDRRFVHLWNTMGYTKNLPITRDRMPRFRLGSWVGGDRDGHPFVTAEVTRQTLGELGNAARQLIVDQLEDVEKHLVLSIHAQQPPHKLVKRMRELCAALGVKRESFGRRGEEEPWSMFATVMGLTLRASKSLLERPGDPKPSGSPAGFYQSPEQLLGDLRLLSKSLEQVGAGRIAMSDVFPIIRTVETFGFHLANLDIRQNSGAHDAAVDELLEAAGFEDAAFSGWPEEKRLEFLNEELRHARPFTAPGAKLGKNAESVVSCYQVIAEHLRRGGRAGLGSLIISMTRSLSDLLAVYLIAREKGVALQGPEGLVCPLPVVPLFETLEDLENAAEIMEGFLQHPMTRRSLPLLSSSLDHVPLGELCARVPAADAPLTQQIMLGYSDSNKDAGIVASQWALHCTQKNLLEVGQARGVDIWFFHGRGGTISRGSGPTDRFLEALPKGSLTRGLRMTEQGETIAQKYSNHLTGATNVELLTAGTVGVHMISSQGNGLPERAADLISCLASLSREKYRQLLEHPDFMTFYSQATPIDALENSRIGSRPSRRTGRRTLTDLRAIPWVFSWNQSRFYLPGWFGVGTGLSRLKREDAEGFDYFRGTAVKTHFPRYLLYNVEASLAAADLEIARRYASLVKEEAVREGMLEIIQAEYDLAHQMLEEIFEGPLEERRPRFFKTVHLRDSGLQLLHQQQVQLLRDWRMARETGDEIEAKILLPRLLLSVNAIASGLRTTG